MHCGYRVPFVMVTVGWNGNYGLRLDRAGFSVTQENSQCLNHSNLTKYQFWMDSHIFFQKSFIGLKAYSTNTVNQLNKGFL